MSIFLAAQPRSGSSHIAETLRRITGYTIGYTMPQFCGKRGNEEHVINAITFQVMAGQGKWVFHTHSKGTYNHRYLLEAFGMKPVVITRHVNNSLLSIKQQLDVGAEFINFTKPKHYDTMSDSMKWRYMVTYIAPWLVDWQRSWEGYENAIFVSYEQWFGVDCLKPIHEILRHSGVTTTVTDQQIRAHNKHAESKLLGGDRALPDWVREAVKAIPR